MVNVLIFIFCLMLSLSRGELCFFQPPPASILENDAGPYPKLIQKFGSLKDDNLYMNFSGPGVDEHPMGLFSFDQLTGMLCVNRPIDREEFSWFRLSHNLYDRDKQKLDRHSWSITIKVVDVNDNAPMFAGPLHFSVTEQSDAGTVVGQVGATDRDEENTLHTRIRYTLLTGSDLFAINPWTGVITTVTNTLDREVKDKYMVTIEIKDMKGQEDGLSTTGTATITVDDINDNPPTFTGSSYEVSVRENEVDELLLQIPVEDEDLRNSSNWICAFLITKGNQKGNFRVETDPETNEGLLYVSKALDFERTRVVRLEVTVRNEAELTGTESPWASVPVHVTVTDVADGPQFTTPTLTIPVRENMASGTLIGTYAAVDADTKSSAGIRYSKTTDPASWISLNETTGELRVADTVDRESPLVHSGLYGVIVEAVDAARRTGSGTVILVVEDVNDNRPTLAAAEQVLCERDGELGSVLLVAQDNDQSPFSFPFDFSLADGPDGSWSLDTFNQTAAMLKQIKALPRGVYDVPVHVADLQGFGGTQTVKVRVCQCRNGVCLVEGSSALWWGLVLAPLLLLAALLSVLCLTKRKKLQDGYRVLLRLQGTTR